MTIAVYHVKQQSKQKNYMEVEKLPRGSKMVSYLKENFVCWITRTRESQDFFANQNAWLLVIL